MDWSDIVSECITTALYILMVFACVDYLHRHYKAYRRHRYRKETEGIVVMATAFKNARGNIVAKVKFTFKIKLDDNLIEAIDASTPLPKCINKIIGEYVDTRFFRICREARMDGTDDAAAEATYPKASKLTVVYEDRNPCNSNIASEESSKIHSLACVIYSASMVGILVVCNFVVMCSNGEIIRLLIFLAAVVISCYVSIKRARRRFNKNSVEIQELQSEHRLEVLVNA